MNEAIQQGVHQKIQQNTEVVIKQVMTEVIKTCDGRIKQGIKEVYAEVSKNREATDNGFNELADANKKFNAELGKLTHGLTKQREEILHTQHFCEGITKMITPIKEQVDGLKITVQELKESGNKSDWGSASSHNQDKADPKGLLCERHASEEAMKEMQENR